MPDYSENIDAYLLGRLSGEELQAFEEAMRADPELVRELEFRREVKAGLQVVQGEEVRARIQAIAGGSARKKTSWPWLAAASVALLLGIGWWIWSTGNPPTGQELFAAYYHPQVQFDQPRNPVAGPGLLDTLEERYAARDFAFLQKRLTKMPDSLKNRNLQLLEAVTLIGLKDDQAAAQRLVPLMGASAPTYADEAAWLRALLHVRQEEFAAAAKILQPLSAAQQGLHAEEARKLLTEIETRK